MLSLLDQRSGCRSRPPTGTCTRPSTSWPSVRPGPTSGPEKAVADRLPHLALDGKIFESDRCRQKIVSVKDETIDAWLSGKTGGFGGQVQMLAEPDGFPIWFSDVPPGGVVDIEAARALVLPLRHTDSGPGRPRIPRRRSRHHRPVQEPHRR